MGASVSSLQYILAMNIIIFFQHLQATKQYNQQNIDEAKLGSKKSNLDAIFAEMKGMTNLLTPLTAIETPRISEHEGNNAKDSAPKYSFNLISEPPPDTPINPEPDDIPITKDTAHAKRDLLKGKTIIGCDQAKGSQLPHFLT